MIDRARWREEVKSRFAEEGQCVWPEPTVDDGWRDMICALVDDLDATGVPYKIVQMKEKWGALRTYVDLDDAHPGADSFYRLIDEAERKSVTICELCGAAGTARHTSCVKVLCDGCLEKKRQTDFRFMSKKELEQKESELPPAGT